MHAPVAAQSHATPLLHGAQSHAARALSYDNDPIRPPSIQAYANSGNAVAYDNDNDNDGGGSATYASPDDASSSVVAYVDPYRYIVATSYPCL